MTEPGIARTVEPRRRIVGEMLLVLGLSLGASAVYSIVAITDRLTREERLAEQTATLNRSLSEREVFDLVYQLLGIFFDLAPVALVCFLLWQGVSPRLGRLGIDFARPGRDALAGVALALAIGIPGMGVYLAGRALGWTVTVIPSALDEHWWTTPVLLLSALRAGVTEEVIVVGYLFARLRELGWGDGRIIALSAILRGCYHAYQGIGSFLGNIAMGLLFGWLYRRFGRVLPLVIAHSLIDAAVFVGYPWAHTALPALFG